MHLQIMQDAMTRVRRLLKGHAQAQMLRGLSPHLFQKAGIILRLLQCTPWLLGATSHRMEFNGLPGIVRRPSQLYQTYRKMGNEHQRDQSFRCVQVVSVLLRLNPDERAQSGPNSTFQAKRPPMKSHRAFPRDQNFR